eukprot:scaffold193293_cov17-Tisochrysis_lutea.AAC.1
MESAYNLADSCFACPAHMPAHTVPIPREYLQHDQAACWQTPGARCTFPKAQDKLTARKGVPAT